MSKAPPRAGKPARKIGDWLVRRRLSVGGSSEIFLAEAAESPERVAVLKVLLPHLAEDPATVAAFDAEVALLRGIDSPHLPRVADSGTWLGSPWMAMPFVDGVDLAEVFRSLEGVGLSSAALVALGYQAALALAAVHGATDASGRNLQIVHRDVSPQNFVLGRDGVLTLIDLGIAKRPGVGEPTATGVVKGKHAYMSPEQVRREPLDARSDIFSCGIVLWELATGARLFHGDSAIETMQNVESASFRPIRVYNPEVDPAVSAIIESCLAASPEGRPSDAGVLCDSFHRVMSNAEAGTRRLQEPQANDLLASLVIAASPKVDGAPPLSKPDGERT